MNQYDIEFMVNNLNKLFILQVRPIYIKNEKRLLSIRELNEILSKLKKISKLKKNNIIYLEKLHFLE